jgi:hypothetical protein
MTRQSNFHAGEFGSVACDGQANALDLDIHFIVEFTGILFGWLRMALGVFGEQSLADHAQGFEGDLLSHAVGYEEGDFAGRRWRVVRGWNRRGDAEHATVVFYEFAEGGGGSADRCFGGSGFIGYDGRGVIEGGRFRRDGADLEIRAERHGTYLMRNCGECQGADSGNGRNVKFFRGRSQGEIGGKKTRHRPHGAPPTSILIRCVTTIPQGLKPVVGCSERHA